MTTVLYIHFCVFKNNLTLFCRHDLVPIMIAVLIPFLCVGVTVVAVLFCKGKNWKCSKGNNFWGTQIIVSQLLVLEMILQVIIVIALKLGTRIFSFILLFKYNYIWYIWYIEWCWPTGNMSINVCFCSFPELFTVHFFVCCPSVSLYAFYIFDFISRTTVPLSTKFAQSIIW